MVDCNVCEANMYNHLSKCDNRLISNIGVCAFSGGKDSTLALLIALNDMQIRELIFFDDDEDSQISHIQPSSVLMKQAELMGLPIKIERCNPLSNSLKYIHELKKYRREGVTNIVFGNIGKRLVKYKADLTELSGLNTTMPLCSITEKEYLALMKEYSVKSIITSVKPPIESYWLGELYDEDAYFHFKSLGIDPLGGLGVFHTITIDAKNFKESLKYKTEKIDNQRIRLSLL